MRGLLHDYEPSCGPSFEALVSDKSNKLFTGEKLTKTCHLVQYEGSLLRGR